MIHCMSIEGYDENHVYPSLPLHPATMRVLVAWATEPDEPRSAPTCDEHVGRWIRGALQYVDEPVTLSFTDLDQDEAPEATAQDLQDEFYDGWQSGYHAGPL